jgi:hypothetical protein
MNETIIAFLLWGLFVAIIYSYTGIYKIIECYKLWFKREYWTNYNIIEAVSWLSKAIIIIPGLLFGIEVWQFYIIALITSSTLIWASNKKLLPTLVAFNTLWILLSLIVIVRNIF